MKLSSATAAALLFTAPLAAAAPVYESSHLSATLPSKGTSTQTTVKKPWQVYSLREQPFNDAMLSFVFMDPTTGIETDCKTNLPMSGFANCDDGKTSFIYGGISFQYGETWLSLQRTDIEDCPEPTTNPTPSQKRDETSPDPKPEQKLACKKRSASGTLNLPSNFWQQPGWNSWVHPENLDVHWDWTL